MKKFPLKTLFLCLLAAQAFADYCQGDLFIEATGVGKTPSEASNMAILEIGKRVNVLVESQINIGSVSTEDSDGVLKESGSYSEKSQIESKAFLSSIQKIESKKLEKGEYEFRGYVCNSNIAKPYLDSLDINLRHKLKVFLQQDINGRNCGKARDVYRKMLGWQGIVENLGQTNKTLQSEYTSVNAKIESECERVANLNKDPEVKKRLAELKQKQLRLGK